MPRDGSIKGNLNKLVIGGAVAPLVVAAFAIAAMLAAGGMGIGIAAVAIISVALALSILATGTQRVGALRERFDRATRLANEAATVRLPQALEAARDGRSIGTELTPLVPDEHDELGELISALDRTERTAITLAAEQARTRRHAGEMFVDLGRRHQSLLGRTLTLVAELESKERDPATVADLLRLDHLVTRMRRNAESLLVLAGSEPGRGWSSALSVNDVLRTALSEIEAYDRVDTGALEDAHVVGRAVGAVAHLLAELLENATVFSPPTSRVLVNGTRRPDGYVLAISDHGLGFKHEELVAANDRLTSFRTVEFAPPRQLGLAVVAELARRHGVVVQLSETPGGGTTASVLLPPILLAEHEPAADAPSADVPAASPLPETQPTRAPAPMPDAVPAFATDAVMAAPTTAEPIIEPEPVAEPEPAVLIDLTRIEAEERRPAGVLPQRTPGEQLPDLGPMRSDDGDLPVRDARDVREQLAGFQAGIDRARVEAVAPARPTLVPGTDGSPFTVITGGTDTNDGAPATGIDEAEHHVVADGDNGYTPSDEPADATSLARRVAGAQLPDTGPPRDPSALPPSRTPEEVRSALTSFQHGIVRGTLESNEWRNGDDAS